MRFLLVIFIFIMCFQRSYGLDKPLNSGYTMKGKFYFYWGWNRATYTKSDIHFHGDDFHFTVKKAVALDRQSPFALDPYFKLNQITIPQYNYRIGYFFHPKYNVSVGWDHMKYVMVQDQIAKVTGTIKGTDGPYNRTYDHEDVKMAGDFLQFEHTDGLNYLNAEINRVDDLYEYKKITFRSTFGAAAGVLYPRTRAVVLNREVNDQWHIAGYGISAKSGVNISFYTHFFIQCELKTGFINMPDIIIEANSSNRAKQHFGFVQANIVLGYQFNLIKY